MNLKMFTSSACNWCISALMIPLSMFMVWIYLNVHDLEKSKATREEVSQLDIKYTQQLTRNTVAIENLNDTLKEFKQGVLHGR